MKPHLITDSRANSGLGFMLALAYWAIIGLLASGLLAIVLSALNTCQGAITYDVSPSSTLTVEFDEPLKWSEAVGTNIFSPGLLTASLQVRIGPPSGQYWTPVGVWSDLPIPPGESELVVRNHAAPPAQDWVISGFALVPQGSSPLLGWTQRTPGDPALAGREWSGGIAGQRDWVADGWANGPPAIPEPATTLFMMLGLAYLCGPWCRRRTPNGPASALRNSLEG